MKMRLACLVSAAAVACLSTGSAMGNLLINGDFESGNTGFNTSYDYQTVPQRELPEGDYGITVNPTNLHWATVSFGDHTTGAGLMMMVNGKTTPNSVVWSQTVAVPSNKTLGFSMWAANWNRLGQPLATLEVFLNGQQIGTSFVTPSTPGIWAEFEADWDSGAATTANVEVRLASTFGLGNDFALDDLVLTPEPGSVLLFFVGSIVAGCVCRRTAKTGQA